MKVPVLALLAMVCFTAYNLIIRHKIASFSPIVGVAYVHLLPTLAAILIVLWQKQLNASLKLPSLNQWYVIAAVGFVWLAGEYFMFKAYNSGGSVLLVSTIVLMIPVAASLVEYVLYQNVPTPRHVLAWGFALASVLLIFWGK